MDLLKPFEQAMRAEFGPPTWTKNYYIVQQADMLRRKHIKLYLDRVCVMAKNVYMSKESFQPVYSAEKG